MSWHIMYGGERAQERTNKRRKIGKGERVRERDSNRKKWTHDRDSKKRILS